MQCHGMHAYRLEKQLSEFERKHGIVSRWTTSDQEFIKAKNDYLKETKQQLHSSLWITVVRRNYLLRMKAKYAGNMLVCLTVGELVVYSNYVYITSLPKMIAKRLSSNITKESRKARRIIEEFNAISYELHENHVPLLLVDVLSPSSEFWQTATTDSFSETVPFAVQKDIIQAYLCIKRANEELELLEKEMLNYLAYWSDRQQCINDCLKLYSNKTDLFCKGAQCLLKKLLSEAELHLSRGTLCFSEVIRLDVVPPSSCSIDWINHSDSDESDASDSDDSLDED